MAWNFNNYSNEYDLFASQTNENIDMFGLTVQYIKADGQNLDEIFGEYSHKKLTQEGVLDINVLPENAEDFDMIGNTFSKFGFINTEMFNCYASASTTDTFGYENIRTQCVGDLIVLPNGKKFEITFVEHEVQGTNNMFPYTNNKNVYMFKAKLWNYSGDERENGVDVPALDEEGLPILDIDGNETTVVDDKLNQFDFTSLDDVFNSELNEETEVTEVKTEEPIKRVKTQNTEADKIEVESTDVFGDWG
jgi:hypothetical protein